MSGTDTIRAADDGHEILTLALGEGVLKRTSWEADLRMINEVEVEYEMQDITVSIVTSIYPQRADHGSCKRRQSSSLRSVR